MGEAGGSTGVMWRLQSAFLWRLDTVSFGKTKEMGSNGSRGQRPPPKETAHPHPPRHPPAQPKVGRGTYRLPTGSAHANGGAAGVKKALFFGGSTPFLWASTKEMGSNGRTGQRPHPIKRRTRRRVKKKARACREGEGVVKSTWAGCGIFSKALALFFKCSHLYVIVRG